MSEFFAGLFWIFVGFCLGLFAAHLVSFCRDYFETKNYKKFFSEEKMGLEMGLKEKKNAQLKEINQEVEAARSKATQQIQQAEQEAEAKKKVFFDKTKLLENNYLYHQNELKKDYEKQKQEYQKMQQEELDSNNKQNAEALLAAQRELDERLSGLKEDYEAAAEKVKLDFLAFSGQINQKKENLQQEIDSYEERQKNIIARFQEDERLKSERNFYHIAISENAKIDVIKLKNLAQTFNQPNIIYKLIYEVYYKSLTEALFKKVLGENVDKGGIYKITDITNEKVYIGRAVNFKERWRTHCKRGCGIEKINGLLYDRMMEIGVENFTFEVVEVCSKEEQSEKEKYWIKFYRSDEWGYNQNKGG